MATNGGRKKPSNRPDIATLGGLLLAGGGILGGLLIEGGKLTDITQVTALMIVLGGTLGAVMVTTPLKTLIRAAKYLGTVFFEKAEEPHRSSRKLFLTPQRRVKTASFPWKRIWKQFPTRFSARRFH